MRKRNNPIRSCRLIEPVIKEGRENVLDFNPEDLTASASASIPTPKPRTTLEKNIVQPTLMSPADRKTVNAVSWLTYIFFILGFALSVPPLKQFRIRTIKNDTIGRQVGYKNNLLFIFGTDLLIGVAFIAVAVLNLVIAIFKIRQPIWFNSSRVYPAPWSKLTILGAVVTYAAFFHLRVRIGFCLVLACLDAANAYSVPCVGNGLNKFPILRVLPSTVIYLILYSIAVYRAIVIGSNNNPVTLLCGVAFPMMIRCLPFIVYFRNITKNKKDASNLTVKELLWYLGVELLMYLSLYSQLFTWPKNNLWTGIIFIGDW